MHMYGVHGTVPRLSFSVRVAWGVPWAAWGSEDAVAQRPELLANHWLQLLWWTERQAPNVNIGVVHCNAEQFCLEDWA